MEHDRITPRQAYFLLALFFLGNLLTATGAKGKPTGWLSFVLLALLAAPMLGMTLSLAGRDPAGEILPQALGRGAGTAATVILCLLAILLAGDALSAFAGFIVANDLNNAGAVGNTLLLSGACLLLVCCGGGTLGRMAWLIQPWTVLLLLGSLALTAPYTKLESLLPLFTEGTAHFARATAVSFLTFFAPAAFLVFSLGGKVAGKWTGGAVGAGVLACVLLALLTGRDAAVLGGRAAQLFRFPSYVAANTSRHGEVLLSVVFVLVQPFRAAIFLRFVRECLVSWRPQGRGWYPFVLTAAAAALCLAGWSRLESEWRVVEVAGASLIVLAVTLVAWMGKRLRKKREKSVQSGAFHA